jgi:hypothetical protein
MMDRALLAMAVFCAAIQHAGAQSDSPPPQQQPKCQALLNIRDELQKHGQAISTANQKKADVKVACGLFRRYIATEARMLKMLEADGASCGAPSQVIQQVRGSHAKAQQIGKQVCDAARQPLAPPRLDDQLLPIKPMPRPEPWPTRLSER